MGHGICTLCELLSLVDCGRIEVERGASYMKKQIEYTPVFSDIMDSNTTINSDENLKADKKTGI